MAMAQPHVSHCSQPSSPIMSSLRNAELHPKGIGVIHSLIEQAIPLNERKTLLSNLTNAECAWFSGGLHSDRAHGFENDKFHCLFNVLRSADGRNVREGSDGSGWKERSDLKKHLTNLLFNVVSLFSDIVFCFKTDD